MRNFAQQRDGGASAAEPIVDAPQVSKRGRHFGGRAEIVIEQFGDYFASHIKGLRLDIPCLERSIGL